MSRAIRVATRRSQLALAQAELVRMQIEALTGQPCELVPVTSDGDRLEGSLAGLTRTGVFVTAVRQVVLAGDADLAVHSLKDLPTSADAGVAIAAIPIRADARDALVCRSASPAEGANWLDVLPQGARVGTGSPRRASQLRLARKDLSVVPVRGNVDTRVRLIDGGTVDAVVVAMAGLCRLGLGEIGIPIPTADMLPAAGQGALAIEWGTTAEPSAALATAMAALDDRATRTAVTAERSLLAELEAGCSSPVGAFARVEAAADGAEVALDAIAIALDGDEVVRMQMRGPAGQARSLGRHLARELLTAGGAALIGKKVP